MLTTTIAYVHQTPSSGKQDRLELLREMVRDYATNEMVDIRTPQFLWPILCPLEIGLTSELGWELGPIPDHQKYGWDNSYDWVIEAVKGIYPAWNRVEEEFGRGAMLNIEKPNIAHAIARTAGAEFIGVEECSQAQEREGGKLVPEGLGFPIRGSMNVINSLRLLVAKTASSDTVSTDMRTLVSFPTI